MYLFELSYFPRSEIYHTVLNCVETTERLLEMIY